MVTMSDWPTPSSAGGWAWTSSRAVAFWVCDYGCLIILATVQGINVGPEALKTWILNWRPIENH